MCLACDESDSIVSRASGKAAWVASHGLSHAGPPRVPDTQGPPDADIRIMFRVPPELRGCGRLVWWAATGRRARNAWSQPTPFDAYRAGTGGDAWPNSGCVAVTDDGFASISCVAPQPYMEEETLWTRHVHVMGVSKENVSAVDPSVVFTIGVRPAHRGENEDYACEAIPDKKYSGNLFVDVAQAREAVSRGAWAVDATGQHVNVLGAPEEKFISTTAENGSLAGRQIQDDPVIVYCANPKCNAARRLLAKWQSLGRAPNYFYMPEGYEKLI